MDATRDEWLKETEREVVAFQDVDGSAVSEEMIQAMRETAQLDAVKQLRSWTAPFFSEATSILDAGCGLGDVLIQLARGNPNLQATGLDFSSKMLEVAQADARQAQARIEWKQGSATELPFPDATFDAVRSERTLQWIDAYETAIYEMIRVLKPGGRLVLIDTDWRSLSLDLNEPDLEWIARKAMGALPRSSAGARLRRLLMENKMIEVQQQVAVQAFNDWEDPLGSKALPPPFILSQLAKDLAGATDQQAAALETAMGKAGHAGTFQATIVMHAVAAVKP
jgi:ubiquinone/menaquinone biosynthesis C-methylase UbiE